MATEYATLDQVRDYGEYLVDDIDDDAQIEALIPQVSYRFETYTGRVLVPDADATKYFTYEEHVQPYDTGSLKGRGNDLFMGMEDDPLLSITTLTNGDGTSIASSEYFLLPRGASRYHTIRIKEASTIGWEDDTDGYIAVTGRWGWSATIPDDLNLACIEAVLYIVKGRKNIMDYERPQVSKDGVVMLPKSLPQRVWDTLNYYKKRI